MTIKPGWIQLLMVSSVLILSGTPACAQITPDRTLGAEGSRLTPNVQIKGASADRIDGGSQRGSNLFHSFSQFNINNRQRVYFVNPNGVQNILTRITGKSASYILGTLGVFGSANLFLLNPNGILFGQNARLDLGGSFVGTTANAIRFGEQGIFSATVPEAPPLLTVNPSALLFNQLHPEAITNQSQARAGISPAGQNVTGLRVPDTQSLLLVGGNINVNGGGLRAYGGNIELAGLAAPGNVSLNLAGNNLSLAIPDNVERADVSLSNQAQVNVRGADGGRIKIQARNVNMAGESILRAGIDTGLGTPNSLGGNIEINATGATTLSDSTIANVVSQRAFGKAGDINIKSGSFTLRDGTVLTANTYGQGDAGSIFIQSGSCTLSDSAQVSATTFGQGNAGSVFIQALDTASIAYVSIFSSVESGGVGNGGDINIQARSLTLSDGTQLIASTSGRGNAGSVFIQASDAVSLIGKGTAIFSNVGSGGVGNGGDINIKAGSLNLTDGAQLQTAVIKASPTQPSGRGNAGNVNIDALGAVTIASAQERIFSGISSDLETGATGNGGNISIRSGSFRLGDGALLSASTFGQGDAGSVFIQASDAVSLAGTVAIFSNLESGGAGQGGNINIQAGAFTLSDGAQIQTAVKSDSETLPGGRGNAGNVNLDVRAALSITGSKDGIPSAILSSVGTGATGNGGDIKIKSGSFDMSDDARLNTTTLGQGNAGSVFIQASDAVSLANAYIFTATKVAPGTIANGGAISIQARNLSLTKGSSLFASTSGQGNAGNISLQVADSVSISSKSTIFSAMAPGAVGNGGNLDVQAGSLSLTDESSISASNLLGKGNAGNISINTVNNVSINGGAFVSSATGGQGNAGKVAIRAGGAVSIAGRGESTPSSVYNRVVDSGVGNGGDIEIQARSLSLSDDAELTTTTLGKGDAGNVQINAAKDITFTSGGQITAQTLGQGNAGNVTLTAGSAVSFDGVSPNRRRSGIFTNVGADSGLVGKGQGGNISITAPNLSITNFTAVSSSSQGQGNAGDITINSGSVRLDNQGTVAALTNSGNGGNINLTAADFLLLRHNSSISTTAGLTQSGGDGGNITIHTPFIVALPHS